MNKVYVFRASVLTVIFLTILVITEHTVDIELLSTVPFCVCNLVVILMNVKNVECNLHVLHERAHFACCVGHLWLRSFI